MSVLYFTDENFQNDILDEKGLALVDFWAPWCGPCHIFGPTIEELAEEYKGKIKIGKMNVDENPKTAEKYQVMSIPTVIIFKGGQIVDQLIGVQPKAILKEKLDKLLS